MKIEILKSGLHAHPIPSNAHLTCVAGEVVDVDNRMAAALINDKYGKEYVEPKKEVVKEVIKKKTDKKKGK